MRTSLQATFRVPATRGRMGNTTYYTTSLRFGIVVKVFVYDPEDMPALPPEDRTQRELKKRRVPEIAEYILGHDDYIFSAVTVSVDVNSFEFESVEPGSDIGVLHLPPDADYIVNDGQHRIAGIAQALREDPTLANDSISVVLLPDGGTQRSQQIFSDLNRTVHKTSKSLDILYDHRLPINQITMDCVDAVQLFQGRTDKERVSLSVRNQNFATLSGIQRANTQLLGDIPEGADDADISAARDYAIDFWNRLTQVVSPWPEIAAGTKTPAEARQDYLSSYTLVLWALGRVGASLREQGIDLSALDALAEVDWRKSNSEWEGICVLGQSIITRTSTRDATGELLKYKLGLRPDAPAAVLDTETS
ncbi:DNA sulfur modification protein DndB [Candidatus Poriferisodalis sp.]|uniref:DNA sulfur modification protein DndB n=1 Tax=Candidatus Poriferisodalis sp. TaxID=3101277 RepID=UPI003D0A85D3